MKTLRMSVTASLVITFHAGWHASAADLVWTNTTGGNWSTPANWEPNQVPGAADDAFITNAGTYTVTINASSTAAMLLVGADAGTQTLSLAGSLTGATVLARGGAQLVAAGGTLNAVTLDGHVSIANGNSLRVVNGLTLTNGATITLNSAGNYTYLEVFSGTQTIGGDGQIIFGGSAPAN
ncbi:MAG TPA: hypothetical protein VNO52_04590, partial [Methylomirabilota bacterium]|nr:hypothetical protein [Methylomirabilota bacterium]